MDELYIIGEKVAGGYPEGRYVATKLRGRVHDHYIIVGVLNCPSVRSVANRDAMSRAEARKYGSIYSVLRGDERSKEPERYDGYWNDDSERAYNDSLLEAWERERRRLIAEGDTEAAFEAAKRAAKLSRTTF